MFSKLKDSSAVKAANAQRPSQPNKNARQALSILGMDIQIEGQLDSKGDIQLDGRVYGNINSVSLTIGEKAHIKGDISAGDVIIYGRVSGNIRSGKVRLMSSARVEGDIFYSTLAVDSGACLDGNCRHVEKSSTADKSKSPLPIKGNGHTKTKPAASEHAQTESDKGHRWAST